MGPGLGYAIGGIGGALLGGIFGDKGQASANRTNIMLAREQMAFQERMSNTAVQRRMVDMRKAGINPILAGKYEASSPAGQTATVQNEKAMRAAAMQQAAITGAQVMLMRAQAKKELAQANAIKPVAEAGESVGDLVDQVMPDKKTIEGFIGSSRNVGKHVAEQFKKGVAQLSSILDVSGEKKANALEVHRANVADRKEIKKLEAQIEMDEKMLKIYRNEDVDTAQIIRRIRDAKHRLALLKGGK